MRTTRVAKNRALLAPPKAAAGDLSAEVGDGITAVESSAIVALIRPSFTETAATYDTNKYWPDVYSRVQAAFLAPKKVQAKTLDEALRWKWGHLSKTGMPGAHRRLISQLQREWPSVAPHLPQSPELTFAMLETRFGGTTRFITVAFLVHLLFQERIPIIDQHNFRAVNALIGQVRPTWRSKKKPSRFSDILLVAGFMSSVAHAWRNEDPATAPSARELDKFLMMYGKSIKGAV